LIERHDDKPLPKRFGYSAVDIFSTPDGRRFPSLASRVPASFRYGFSKSWLRLASERGNQEASCFIAAKSASSAQSPLINPYVLTATTPDINQRAGQPLPLSLLGLVKYPWARVRSPCPLMSDRAGSLEGGIVPLINPKKGQRTTQRTTMAPKEGMVTARRGCPCAQFTPTLLVVLRFFNYL
jgi:hypothetical protein